MKQLEKDFKGRGEVKGYQFHQIHADADGFIYEVSNVETNNHHYEVFKHVENTQFDNISYPRSNSFGFWAWTAQTIDEAFTLFNSKIKNHATV